MTNCSGLFGDSKRENLFGKWEPFWNNYIDSHGADSNGTTRNLGVKVVYLKKLLMFMVTHRKSTPGPLELR